MDTRLRDGGKSLDQILREVVWNSDIRCLLQGFFRTGTLDMGKPYSELVNFQIRECDKHGSGIRAEGFQVGEPWDGDIEHAPILFLSSNPAYNFHEISPRYHARRGRVVCPACGGVMNVKAVGKFLRTRIQTSPGTGESLHIPLRNGTTKAVPYWGSVRNNTETLLPDDCLKALPKLKRERARAVMRHAVCMEIVPFRSKGEAGVPEALDECWEQFTRHILAHAGAAVFVLVGSKVLNTFTCYALTDGERAKARAVLKNGGIYRKVIGDRERLIVKADFGQGKIGKLETSLDKSVLNQLKRAVEMMLALQPVRNDDEGDCHHIETSTQRKRAWTHRRNCKRRRKSWRRFWGRGGRWRSVARRGRGGGRTRGRWTAFCTTFWGRSTVATGNCRCFC